MLQRPHILAMESVPSAAEMRVLHAATCAASTSGGGDRFRRRARGSRRRRGRDALAADEPHRLVGVRWAASTLLAKQGMGHRLAEGVEPIYLVAFDWGTYRVLTEVAGLSADEYEASLASSYRRMLLGREDSLA